MDNTIADAINSTTNKVLPFFPINLPNKLETKKPKKGNNIIDKNITLE